MSEIERQRIMNKFSYMERYLSELQQYRSISQEDYEDSYATQLTVERLIQLTVQVGIDVNFYILKQLKIELPDNSADSAFEMATIGIIEGELAFRLYESIRMRNLLVHLYDEINPKIVYRSIQDVLQDYPEYQMQITTYLDNLEENQ